MSAASNTPSVPDAWTGTRWEDFSHEERHDIHHALRMLLKHPLTPRGEEAERIQRMADEIWNTHAADTAARFSNGS